MVAGRGVAQLITPDRSSRLTRRISHGLAADRGVPANTSHYCGTDASPLLAVTRKTALGMFIEAVGINIRAEKMPESTHESSSCSLMC